MKPIAHSVLFVAALFFICSGVRAQDTTDAEGCKDSPIVVRMQGSFIDSCDHKAFDQVSMSASKDQDGNGVDQNMEGEVWSWTYQVRDGVSGLQITRNFETAFRQAGVTIDFKADGDKIVAHKGKKYCQIQTGTVSYYQTVVEVKEMQQEVSADASSLSDELTKTGHVAVYGIHFETGKSAILLDSEGTLQEIIKFMTSDTATNLRVEDHTNNVGVPVANQALSERRAQAVVAWLVAHGVPAARLSSRGWGQTQPIADDSTEAGRAKNRRVELVKQ